MASRSSSPESGGAIIDHVVALPSLFDSSRLRPAWTARQQAMVTRCAELLRLPESAGSQESMKLWEQRVRTTESWRE